MRNPNTLNELFGCHSALGRNYPKPVPERRLEPNRSRMTVDDYSSGLNVRRHQNKVRDHLQGVLGGTVGASDSILNDVLLLTHDALRS